MPWNKKNYPVSMKKLPAAVRNKAIEIANALLHEKNMEEGILIATAISRAKDWAVNHGKKIKTVGEKSRSTDVKVHGEDRYVIPYNEGDWAVKEEGENKVEKVFHRKDDAVKQATKEARKTKTGITIQKRSGRIGKKVSFNPNRKKRSGK